MRQCSNTSCRREPPEGRQTCDTCRARVRDWQKRNPEKVKAAREKWLARNPDYKNQQMRDGQYWRTRDQEKVKAARKRWLAKNPDYYKNYRKALKLASASSRADHPSEE